MVFAAAVTATASSAMSPSSSARVVSAAIGSTGFRVGM